MTYTSRSNALLDDLKRLVEAKQKVDEAIIEVVSKLRQPQDDGLCDASWEMIGNALGVTRSAAYQRFDKWCEYPEGHEA